MTEPLPEWPLFGLAQDVRPALRAARDAGRPLALATLVSVEGGGPRPAGTQMVFADGIAAGYFSGGCVESDVAGHAAACLEDGQARTLVYGEGSPWPDIRLLCGARIEIFVERLAPGDRALSELLAAEVERREVIYISDGAARACAAELEPWPEARVEKHYEPPARLIVVGSDPTAIAIAQLGSQAEFQTTLVRPKGPESPPPVAGLGYVRLEPGPALASLDIDPWTAVAIATHDSEIDHEALKAALPSRAGYVGLLGARRRLPERLARLRAEGLSEGAIGRLHAPIGLDIGGKAPWEVAISVIGEIVAVRYARSSNETSTTSPASAAGAPGERLSSASAPAKTVISEES